jgi:WD40 repeat protein/DNA-binding SARP family transcriptional activator
MASETVPEVKIGQKYRLFLLGPLTLTQNGQPQQGFESRKARGLLAYLVAAGKPVFRSELALLFWPSKPEKRGRANLSRVLNNLSQLLPDCFAADRHTIEFRPATAVWVDLHAFQTGLTAGELPDQEAAAQLYRGDFIEGLALDDCPDFELWLLTEREHLRQQATGLLEQLITCHLQGKNYEPARQLTAHLLLVQPDLEAAHRQMMWLLASTGQQQAALSHYEGYVRTLADELGAPPEAETVALAQVVRQGDAFQLGPAFLNGSQSPYSQKIPYVGLSAFGQADAPFFFGREAAAQQLAQVVAQAVITAVVGSSGSGKSSLVSAGLIPRLVAGGWQVISFRPGDRPREALAGAIASRLPPEAAAPERLAAQLRQGELALTDLLAQLPADGPLLLVIDQFEELYTLVDQPALQRRFLELLLQLHSDRPAGIHIVFTLRADFMAQALAFRPFADILQANTFMLGPMNRQELTEAIVQPAAHLGVSFEPGLVERILDDVGSEPGTLPLLEFALTTLWQTQAGGQLTHAAYQQIGRVEGALSGYADQVYRGLTPGEQTRLPAVMQQLVQPGHNTGDTRRLAHRAELSAASWQLVQKLADARLVVTARYQAEETAEIVHEALIAHWWQLQHWLNEARAFRTWQEQFRGAMRQWQESNRDPAALLSGLGLELAGDWLRQRPDAFSPLEQVYIATSLTHWTSEKRTRRRLRQQVNAALVVGLLAAILLSLVAVWGWFRAEDSRRLSDSHRLATQSLNRLFAGDVDLALLLSLEANRMADTPEAIGSLLYGLQRSPYRAVWRGFESPLRQLLPHPDGDWYIALDETGQVQFLDSAGGRLVYQLPVPPAKSIALSQDGNVLAVGHQAGDISLWLPAGRQRLGTLNGHRGSVTALGFDPTGQRLLSGSTDQTLRLWDVSARRPLSEPLNGHRGQIESIAFSPTAPLAASGGIANSFRIGDNHVFLWDTLTGRRQAQITLPAETNVSSLIFNLDGSVLAVGQTNGQVSLWQVPGGQWLGTLADPSRLGPIAPTVEAPIQLALSPDGTLLAVADEVGRVAWWNLADRQLVSPPVSGHTDGIHSLAFTPNGDSLISTGADQTIVQWKMSSLLVEPLVETADRIWSLAIAPDGRLLASGNDQGEITVWDAVSGQSVSCLYTPNAVSLNSVAFSPDGTELAAGSADHHLMLWSVADNTAQPRLLEGHTAGITSVAFSPDGRLLASGSRDKTIRLWKVGSGQPVGQPLQGHTDEVWDVAFHPNGKILASAGWDHTIRLWDVERGRPLTPLLSGHTDAVVSLAFSPDGTILASGSRDKTIRLWNVATGQPLGQPLLRHKDTVWDVSFSPTEAMLASAGCGQPDTYVHCKHGEVRLWHIPDGRALGLPMTMHNDVVYRAVFSPDGKTVLSVGDDARILRWNVDRQKWQSLACDIARRNLTASEWEQYLGDEQYRQSCLLPPPD